MDSTSEPQPPVVPGYVLTLPLLGTGAQGTVWRATRVADRADRAIKVVASCGADALAGSVDNPDMVRVHEVLTLGDGQVAVVMDLMDGGSLRGLVDARGVLTSGETVSLLVPWPRLWDGCMPWVWSTVMCHRTTSSSMPTGDPG